MRAFSGVPFASKTFPATLFGGITAELAGELYVVIKQLDVPVKYH